MQCEPVEEEGRCLVKRVLYPLGVRNVVTTFEREVVLGYTKSVRFEDRLKLYPSVVS